MSRSANLLRFVPVVLLLFLGLSTTAQLAPHSTISTPHSASGDLEYTGDWIFQIAPNSDPALLADDTGFEFVEETAFPGFAVFRGLDMTGMPQDAVESQTLQLEALPMIITAEPVFYMEIEPMTPPDDPYYPDQWHLENTGQSDGTPGEDANVSSVWELAENGVDGITGEGVIIGIADDGLEYVHPDLDNYDPTRSYNYNQNNADPMPVSSREAHGTAVGGVAAANANSKCGVGAAYDATLTGQKFFGPNRITSQMIGDLMGNTKAENSEIDISNNSWGYVSGAIKWTPYQRAAFEDRIENGRNGLGQIYVMSNGNGYQANSWSTRSEFNSSRYTISVAATDHKGIQSYYSEGGSNVLVNAPSNGDGVGITTSDRLGNAGYNGVEDKDCTNKFGGTSSAAPLVTGIVALMLDANPDLTWRDVQHILVETANQNDPSHDSWIVNGAGYHNSEFYGFGRIDATEAVRTALTWENVTAEIEERSGVQTVDDDLDSGGAWYSESFTFDDPTVSSVEYVRLMINATTSYRGDLQVRLTSPDGTTSNLMMPQFDGGNDWDDFPLVTSRFWGESPQGTWTVEFRTNRSRTAIHMDDYEIVLFGTSD